jgi:uncharacterized membrane protein
LVLSKTPVDGISYVYYGALFFIFEAIGLFTWRCQLKSASSLVLTIMRSIFVAFLMYIILGSDRANQWVIYCTVFILGYFQGCFGAKKTALSICTVQQL